MLLCTHLQLENIPVPRLSRQSVDLLTAPQLQKYVVEALRLRRSWKTPSPSAVRRLEIACTPVPLSRIVSLQFLPGRGSRWLLSLALTQDRMERRFALQLWDLEASPVACIATKTLLRFGSLVVNTDDANDAVLAVQSPFIEVFTIDFNSPDPASAFTVVASFPDKVNGLHVLSGTVLLTRDDRDRLYLWDIHSPDNQVELCSFETQPERPLEAIVRDSFAIIVRHAVLEIYGVPAQDFSGPNVTYPVAYHQWQWKLDSVCISFQASWVAAQSKLLPPIGILVRYGSLLPWPINLLHQYVIQPNKSYDPMSPVDPINLPYELMPVLQRTIGSPIRLFATYHMALGTHGMAVWLDSHIEDYFGRGDRGQRLAGCLLPAQDSVKEEVALTSLLDSTMWSSVFAISEDDKWVRVAVSEEEGKIAVGSNDGFISVLEYV